MEQESLRKQRAAIPPRTSRSRWLLIGWIVALLIWRFVCFCWLPLNLQTFPGALFETSSLAFTSLIGMWLILGDGSATIRIWRAGSLLLLSRVLMNAGIIASFIARSQTGGEDAFEIFRIADDEVLITTLALSGLVRWMTNVRISTIPEQEIVALPPRHVSLRQLFILTAVIALLLGARQWDEVIWGDGVDGAIMLFISVHAVAISLTTMSVLMVIIARPNRWAVAGLLVSILVMPFLIGGYFYSARIFEADLWQHLATAVAGPAFIAFVTAGVCRATELRLRWPAPREPRVLPLLDLKLHEYFPASQSLTS